MSIHMFSCSHDLVFINWAPFFFIKFLSRNSSALIYWSSIHLLGTGGALMCRGLPSVYFVFPSILVVIDRCIYVKEAIDRLKQDGLQV